LETYVDGTETSPSLHRSSFSLIKTNNTTRTNTLFVLERFMLSLGFIGSANLIPDASTESVDPFTLLYTVYDLILVVTFLYVGLVKQKVLKVPEIRMKVIAKRVRSHKITQEEFQRKVDAKASDGNKTINRFDLRRIWMKVEDKLIADIEEAYTQYAFKSTTVGGRAELAAYTTARRDAFLKWNRQNVGSDGNEDSDRDEIEDENEKTKKNRLANLDYIRNGNLPQNQPSQSW